MDVSDRPSVSDQPAWQALRSILNPAGPVTVLPSADLPHLFSVISLTAASRSLAHSASQASMLAGRGAGVVVAVAAVEEVAPLVVAAPAAVVALLASELSSPPHATATMPTASASVTSARVLKPRTPWIRSGVTAHRAAGSSASEPAGREDNPSDQCTQWTRMEKAGRWGRPPPGRANRAAARRCHLGAGRTPRRIVTSVTPPDTLHAPP
jgi:hypothetical protein